MVLLLLMFQSTIILLIGLPFGGYLGIKMTLFLILVIEAFEYINLWGGLVLSSIALSLTLAMQYMPINAWNVVLKPAIPHDLWSFGSYALLVVILVFTIQFIKKNQLLATEIQKKFQESLSYLGQINMQLQEYASSAEQGAILEERKRLTREIHDTMGYSFTNLVMMLEAAKYLVKPDQSELLQHIVSIRKQANEGLVEVQRALYALRPGQLTKEVGLAAIHHLISTICKATHIEIAFNFGNAPLSFGEEIDLVIYRFVQEAITNALRHGKATQISVSFSLFGNEVHILIQDNGIGAGVIKESYGLSGMRERIEKIGGRLEISSNYSQGFRLLGIIPLQKGLY